LDFNFIAVEVNLDVQTMAENGAKDMLQILFKMNTLCLHY